MIDADQRHFFFNTQPPGTLDKLTEALGEHGLTPYKILYTVSGQQPDGTTLTVCGRAVPGERRFVATFETDPRWWVQGHSAHNVKGVMIE